MITMDGSVDFGALIRALESVHEVTVAAASHVLIAQTRVYADKGINPDGTAFAPYVPRYARTKKRKGQRVSPPSLRDTGHFLDNIHRVGTTDEIMPAPEDIPKAKGLAKKRTTFEVSSDTQHGMELAIEREIGALLNGIHS